MEKERDIGFFSDKKENEDFNDAFRSSLKSYDAEEHPKIRNLVLSLKKQTPSWDYETAIIALEVAFRIVDISLIKKAQMKKGKDGFSYLREISDLTDCIIKLKKQIGIDPKSLATRGEGSISETMADIATKLKFNKRQFVCKPIWGKVRRSFDIEEKTDSFANSSEDQVDSFLQEAQQV
jgi:hypothetical protein